MSDAYIHKVRLGVVLVKDDKLLLVRQNNRPFWVLPGGTLEADEGMAECAAREMMEETGLEVCIERLLYIGDYIQPPAEGVNNATPRHTIDAVMLGTYVSGEPVMEESENINEMGFFTPDEFREMPMQPLIVADRIRADWPTHFLNVSGVYLGRYHP